jgi:hypothetical protein
MVLGGNMYIRYSGDFKVVDKVTAKWFKGYETLKDVVTALVNNLEYFPQVLCSTTYSILYDMGSTESEIEYIIKNSLTGKYTSRHLVSVSRLASAIFRATKIGLDYIYMSSNGCSYIVGNTKICSQRVSVDKGYVKIEFNGICSALTELVDSYNQKHKVILSRDEFGYTLADATYYYKYKGRSIVNKDIYVNNCVAVIFATESNTTSILRFGVEYNGTYYMFDEYDYSFHKLESNDMRSIIYRSVPNPSFGSFEKFKLNTKRKDQVMILRNKEVASSFKESLVELVLTKDNCDDIVQLYNALCNMFPQYKANETRHLYGKSTDKFISNLQRHLEYVTAYTTTISRFAKLYVTAYILSNEFAGSNLLVSYDCDLIIVNREYIVTFRQDLDLCMKKLVYEVSTTKYMLDVYATLNKDLQSNIGIKGNEKLLRKAISTYVKNKKSYTAKIGGKSVSQMDYGLYMTDNNTVEFFLADKANNMNYLFNPASEELYEWVSCKGKVIFFEINC